MTAARNRPTFMLRLRPIKHTDGIRELRALLKILLRRYGWRCVDARAVDDATPQGAGPSTNARARKS